MIGGSLGIHDFGVYLSACVLLNLTPGQDTLYILGRSLAQGRLIGVASVAGIATGIVAHTLAAAAGLSAVLAASAAAFAIVRLGGAAYLIYLGVQMFRARAVPTADASFGAADAWSAYRQGFLTNLLNPKVVIFFLAFLPQFINADCPSTFLAFVVLGLSFVTTGTLWCLCLVWGATAIGDRLRGNAGVRGLLHRAAGAVFVWLGLRLAISR